MLVYFLTPAQSVAGSVSGDSARLFYNEANSPKTNRFLKKKLAMIKVLEKYNSPLLESVNSFLTVCQSYELDCYLLPSIAGLESSFGKHVLAGSNNPFGWGNGYIMFDNWEHAIGTVGKGLRENYINKGADSVDEIAPIYAESKTWAPRVNHFKTQFEEEERKIDFILSENTVKL